MLPRYEAGSFPKCSISTEPETGWRLGPTSITVSPAPPLVSYTVPSRMVTEIPRWLWVFGSVQ
jgi:hypothetical protein